MLMLFIGLSASLISTAYLFRGLSNGFYLGEIFDTRLMVILHEHWFRFFAGKTSFLDAEFFYPYERSFALTDTFLLSGITHSLLRVLGLDLINAWAVSQFIWIFIGLLGFFLLAQKIIQNRLLQVLSIPLIATSFPFIAHLNERPNVIPYLLSSWVFLFLFNFYFSKSKNQSSLYIGLFLIAIPLIVLTSWYAGFLLVVYLTVLLILSLLVKASYLKTLKNNLRSLNYLILTPFFFSATALTSLWAYIYIPELSSSAEIARPLSEVVNGSPAIRDLFNNSAMGGSQIFTFLNTEYRLGQEELVGMSFFLIISVAVLGITGIIASRARFSSASSQFLLISTLAAGLIEILIIKFSSEYSFFIFLFEKISFLKSIRTPIRWHIYFYILLIFILVFLIDRFLKNTTARLKYLLLLLPLVLLFDQQRVAPGLWQKDEFIASDLLSYQGKLKNCDAFVLDRPDTGMWLDIIESLALTVYVNKSSVKGYSGSRPQNYPSLSWYVDGDLPAIGNWLSNNPKAGEVCFLDGINFKNILKYTPARIDYSVGRGFTGIEKTKNSSWSWSVWQSSTFYVQSFKSNDHLTTFEFNIETPACLDNSKFEVKINGIIYTYELIQANSLKVQIHLLVPAWERIPVEIKKNEGFCKVGDDPRELHFSIKDVSFN